MNNEKEGPRNTQWEKRMDPKKTPQTSKKKNKKWYVLIEKPRKVWAGIPPTKKLMERAGQGQKAAFAHNGENKKKKKNPLPPPHWGTNEQGGGRGGLMDRSLLSQKAEKGRERDYSATIAPSAGVGGHKRNQITKREVQMVQSRGPPIKRSKPRT